VEISEGRLQGILGVGGGLGSCSGKEGVKLGPQLLSQASVSNRNYTQCGVEVLLKRKWYNDGQCIMFLVDLFLNL
jgi:hypothetical protein